jgi:dolichol-phosphate mannosyltransferase
MRLSVAAPAYNESATIATVIDEWSNYLRAHPDITQWEIVVCNDGSTDETGDILAAVAQRISELVVVTLESNQGAGAAIAEAIRGTSLDWVLLTDSDGQFPIDNLDHLITTMRSSTGAGVRAYSGARDSKADAAGYRWGSWASGAVSNLLHGTHYRDFNSVFKLLEGPLFRSLPLESEGMNCSTEITSRVVEMGIDWVEVPIAHRPREAGARSWGLARGASHRLLFVGYLGFRQLLLRWRVLRCRSANLRAVDLSVNVPR